MFANQFTKKIVEFRKKHKNLLSFLMLCCIPWIPFRGRSI